MKAELSKVQHARSAKDFPEIDLEHDEYVVLHIKRSRVGIAFIWGVVALMAFALSIILIYFATNGPTGVDGTVIQLNDASKHYLRIIVLALYILFFFGGFVVKSIYDAASSRSLATRFSRIRQTLLSSAVLKTSLSAKAR